MNKYSCRVKILYSEDVDPQDLESRIGQLIDSALSGSAAKGDDKIISVTVVSDNTGDGREYVYEFVKEPTQPKGGGK